jgi:DNA-directed RNA polymerase specialized sigma24 family protein
MSATTAPFPVPFDADLVQRAVRRLPARHRTVLCLRFADGLSERQVAEVLGCSVSTVHRLTARGVHRVRRQLAAGGSADAGVLAAQAAAPQTRRVIAR